MAAKRKRWTEFELKKLKTMKEAGVSWPEIEDYFRHPASLCWKAYRNRWEVHPGGKAWRKGMKKEEESALDVKRA